MPANTIRMNIYHAPCNFAQFITNWSSTCYLQPTMQASRFRPENFQILGNKSLQVRRPLSEILMSAHDFLNLRKELESRVLARTGNRLSGLGIECSPDGIRLFGKTSTFYVKQLAQHCVREILPEVQLVNDISVL